MPTNCEIIIENNEERVYYGGQMIEGRVRLTLAKGKIVRGNYLLLATSDSTCWFSFLFSFFFVVAFFVGNNKKVEINWTNLSVFFIVHCSIITRQCCCFEMVKITSRILSIYLLFQMQTKIKMTKYPIAWQQIFIKQRHCPSFFFLIFNQNQFWMSWDSGLLGDTTSLNIIGIYQHKIHITIGFFKVNAFSLLWLLLDIDVKVIPTVNQSYNSFSSFSSFMLSAVMDLFKCEKNTHSMRMIKVFTLNFWDERIVNGSKERVIEKKRTLAQKPI